jgi:hypothetical protein
VTMIEQCLLSFHIGSFSEQFLSDVIEMDACHVFLEGPWCCFWILIIFLIQRFFSSMLGPHSLKGGVGGIPPPAQLLSGGSKGGGDNFCSPP